MTLFGLTLSAHLPGLAAAPCLSLCCSVGELKGNKFISTVPLRGGVPKLSAVNGENGGWMGIWEW